MKQKIITDSIMKIKVDDKINLIADILMAPHEGNVGLMGGNSGEVLFWAYYSKYMGLKREKSVLILSSIFDEINKGYHFPTFSTGLSGVGWLVEHLSKNKFISINTDKTIGDMDEFLYPQMLDLIRDGNFDYLHGALGIGLYYIERYPNPKTTKYLIKLVDELERLSINVSGGIAWETVVVQDSNLRGFNLSLSHGIASIIVFLCRVNELGIQKNKTYELISKAIFFLLNSKCRQSINTYQFPAWVGQTNHPIGGRLAWCYNDLGIATALWQAGMILKNKNWKQEGLNVLFPLTKITNKNEAGVRDAGLCHGASGIAHTFNRMYNYTNNNAFKNSALFWFEECLKLATFHDGLAGYKVYRDAKFGGWQNVYGYLEGISGIGLALISAVSNIDANWDRSILLS
jgi:lantibiotic modifying enzyme